MSLPLVVVLIIFILGIVLGEKRPVRLVAGLALLVGVLVASNSAGRFVHTLAVEAWSLVQ